MGCCKTKRAKIHVYCSLFALISLFWSTSLLAAAGPQKGRPAAPVKVAVAMEQLIAPTNWVSGTIISRNDARLAAEVAGRLVNVAEVGSHFKKGETIVKIEDTTFRLQLAESRARVVREQARLKFLKNEVSRLENLSRLNSAAKTQLDQAESDRDVAKSELDVAHVQVDQAKEQLSRTEIRAPFDGVVTERLLRTGERVDKGDIVVRFIDASTIEVQARVSYTSISHLVVGSELNIKMHTDVVQGIIRTLVPVGDDQSRLYDVRLNLDAGAWSVGQALQVAVPTAIAKKSIVVPRDALVLRRNGVSVFKILEDNSAARIAVKTGVASGAMIEVIGDIQAGDRVVTRGGERLRPRQKVKILADGAK